MALFNGNTQRKTNTCLSGKTNSVTTKPKISQRGDKTYNTWQIARLFILLSGIIVLLPLSLAIEKKQHHNAAMHEYSAPWAFYTGKSLDISDHTYNARATYWKPDGTIIYVVGRDTDNVAAYILDEPWQINTARYLHETKIPGQNQHGLYIREDGLMMWVFDRTSIWSFTLETAWDITTRSGGMNHDLSQFAQRGHDIEFKPDGTILYIDDRIAGAVFEYSLTTPWDITSGSLTYTLDISDQQKEVRGIEFLQQGKVMMLMDTGRDEVLRYILEEPWNISTATYFDAANVSAQTQQGRGLSFSADETLMFITGRNEQKIFQYSMKE